MPNVGIRTTKRTRSRNFILTLNNPRLGLCGYESKFVQGGLQYTAQIEKGKNGTPHLQAFIRFASSVDFSRAKGILGDERPHIERCGNVGKSEAYCRKEETRVDGPITNIDPEYFLGGQGRRTDLQEVAEKAQAGASMASIAEEHPATFIKFHRGEFNGGKAWPLV